MDDNYQYIESKMNKTAIKIRTVKIFLITLYTKVLLSKKKNAEKTLLDCKLN